MTNSELIPCPTLKELDDLYRRDGSEVFDAIEDTACVVRLVIAYGKVGKPNGGSPEPVAADGLTAFSE